MTYREAFYRSWDGLKLYYRDYPGPDDKLPVLCLPGLTRNCRDFETLAAYLSSRRRVITPDQRGRGRSQYDARWLNYQPSTYVEDMWTLLRELNIARVIVIGTSLGGLMAMLMASLQPQVLAGVVLNDIGPELDPIGARRIQNYVGKLPAVKNWSEAVALMQQTHGDSLRNLSEEAWLKFARATYREDVSGTPVLDSDPMIGEMLRSMPAGSWPGLWFAYAALQHIPTLLLRGEFSDLLSRDTVERMQREKTDLQVVTVANRGHAPQLDEPECVQAIDAFLDALP